MAGPSSLLESLIWEYLDERLGVTGTRTLEGQGGEVYGVTRGRYSRGRYPAKYPRDVDPLDPFDEEGNRYWLGRPRLMPEKRARDQIHRGDRDGYEGVPYDRSAKQRSKEEDDYEPPDQHYERYGTPPQQRSRMSEDPLSQELSERPSFAQLVQAFQLNQKHDFTRPQQRGRYTGQSKRDDVEEPTREHDRLPLERKVQYQWDQPIRPSERQRVPASEAAEREIPESHILRERSIIPERRAKAYNGRSLPQPPFDIPPAADYYAVATRDWSDWDDSMPP